jgi:hypothetical protein
LTGFQLAGGVNVAHDFKIPSFQVAGLGNGADKLTGLQMAGGINIITRDFMGVQTAILGNGTDKLSGLQMAGGINFANDFKTPSIQIAVLGNAVAGHDSQGLQVAGLANFGGITGIQVAGLANVVLGRSVVNTTKGLQLAGGINTHRGNFTGVQIAGLENGARNITGIQVAGIFNRADNMSGIQIGLINYCKRLKGIQIGVINIISETQAFPVLPIINASF